MPHHSPIGSPEACHIASLVVLCQPGNLDAVAESICLLPGLEVPERDERGKLVALVEAPDEASLLDAIRSVEDLPGVISANLVFHQLDD